MTSLPVRRTASKFQSCRPANGEVSSSLRKKSRSKNEMKKSGRYTAKRIVHTHVLSHIAPSSKSKTSTAKLNHQVPKLPLRALRLHQRPHLQRLHQAHPDSASIPEAQAQHNLRSGDAYDRHRSRQRLGRTRTPRLLVCLLRVF